MTYSMFSLINRTSEKHITYLSKWIHCNLIWWKRLDYIYKIVIFMCNLHYRLHSRFLCSTEYCKVELRSFSMHNTGTEQYSYIAVNNVTFLLGCTAAAAYPNCNPQPVVLRLRGVNLMTMDMNSCNASDWKWFDTYSLDNAFVNDPRCSGQTPALMNYFSNQITNGTIVLGMTNDEPAWSLGPALPMLLGAGINVADVTRFGMFAFVMQKGYPAKTVFVKSNARPTGLSLAVTVTRTGLESN